MSFTSVTVIVEVAVAALKAVVPPLFVVETIDPSVPLVWSQARKVIEMGMWLMLLPFMVSGRNRSLSVGINSSAPLSDTVPKSIHVPPLSIEYCHLPLVTVADPMTAIPCTAPKSTSVSWPAIRS